MGESGIMQIYDVTMPIYEGMMAYKNKEENEPQIKKTRSIEQGSNETKLTLYSHGGTHVDAPYHMLDAGYTLDKIPLNQLYGKCKVLDLTHVDDVILEEHIEKYEFDKGDFIFLKTKNSMTESFDNNFIYLSPKAAQHLMEKGVEVVGIDALSIERNCPEHTTHNILLGGNILIVEGLRLKEIEEGEYTAVIAPLPILGGDGSPARVLLLRDTIKK